MRKEFANFKGFLLPGNGAILNHAKAGTQRSALLAF
jgi:hypothetical protein